jgi:TolB-like protein
VSQGNGNGRIEPNELVEVRLVVANRGRGVARGVSVALESGDRYVRPTTEPVALGALAPGEERRVALGFVVARRYQGGAALPLQVQLGEERARFRARGDLRFVLNRAVDGASVVDLTGAAPTAGEERRVAVLELRNQAAVPPDAAAYLTDLIRRAAVASLARSRYFVMTRENILEQLPPGVTDLAACLGDCEVETGRNVGADFVVSGEILAFGAGLRVTIKLHDTTSGALVATETAAGADLGAVEEDVTRAASTAFAGIR